MYIKRLLYSVSIPMIGRDIIHLTRHGLLENIEDFANSLTIFDDMGDNIGIPAVEILYSLDRYLNIVIICVGHTVTDFSPKEGDYSPTEFNNINSSHLFIERVQEKYKIDYNLYRFKHYNYGVINYSITD